MNKKFKNNSLWGVVTMLLNALILLFFIFTIISLTKFDKENIELVDIKPKYEEKNIALYEAKQPMRQDSVAVHYYSTKLDSLKIVTPTNNAERKTVNDEIKRISSILENQLIQKARTDSIVEVVTAEYNPIKEEYDSIVTKVDSKHSTFLIFLVITIILFFIKILLFATWSYKNSKNIHHIASWMKEGHAPYWTYLSWFIPIYNLIKPFSVTSEIVNETEYILTEKEITPAAKLDNTEFLLGIWWAFLLLATVICSLILHSTFFTEGPMFAKFNHLSVAITALIIWIIYLAIEVLIIIKQNKYNKLLIANQSKFNS